MALPAGTFTQFPSKYLAIAGGEPHSVLLQTCRFDSENRRSFLFVHPQQVLSIRTPHELPALFAQIEDCLRRGLFVAGYFEYECGYHFEPIDDEKNFLPADRAIAWLGAYSKPYVFDHELGEFESGVPHDLLTAHPETNGFEVRNYRLDIGEERYEEVIGVIHDYIRAGHTYQVNFTDRLAFDYRGSPVALFSALAQRQAVSYSAFLNLDDRWILSLSPELFFRLEDRRIITRPMKGTAARGRHLAEDDEIATWLRGDPKNRSEHVMIVDLFRNDLGRVAEIGSVRVDSLFAVEKYETLFQMTSTISATLKPGLSYYQLFRSIFPSGSVTGAPKIRTMQIIDELESKPRGIYTGAIGYFAPGGQSAFNVAIRTLVLTPTRGEMGVGGGIVFDSDAKQEYEECQLKVDFLVRPREDFDLLETILWDGEYRLLNIHLDRLRSSAAYFGFELNTDDVLSRLAVAEGKLQAGSRHKVRLLAARSGELRVETAPLGQFGAASEIALAPVQTSSRDPFLFHKTSHREFYEHWYAEARRLGLGDYIFLNERGEVTEGTINNIFVEKNGSFLTPPVECGLLPGVFRGHVLQTYGRASVRVLYAHDLESADAIHLCNSVRGMRKVALRASAGESLEAHRDATTKRT